MALAMPVIIHSSALVAANLAFKALILANRRRANSNITTEKKL